MEPIYPTPTEGQNEDIPVYVYHGVKGVPIELAFHFLVLEYDSVRFTRSSDGASAITYSYIENATDAQRYFFTRETWSCAPEGEELMSRTYTFVLKR